MDGFWNLPIITQDAIFCGIAGGLAALLGALLRATPYFDKSQNTSPVLAALFIGLALTFGNVIAAPYRHAAHVDAAMTVIEENKLFAALFKYHPQSRATLRAALTDIPDNASSQEVTARAEAAAHSVLDAYMSHDLLYAPDNTIHGIIEADLAGQTLLQPTHPDLCVNFFLGKLATDPSLIPPALTQQVSQAGAAVIEGAALHPSPPPVNPDRHALALQVVKAFHDHGYDVGDLVLLGRVTDLPPDQGCRLAIEYSTVLAAMPDAQASTILKGFNESRLTSAPQ